MARKNDIATTFALDVGETGAIVDPFLGAIMIPIDISFGHTLRANHST